MEIFLAPKVAAKRAPTFQINVAVTNFAPERMYRINADLLRTNVLVQNNEHRQSRQFPYRGRKSSPQVTSKRKWGGVERLEAGRSQGVCAAGTAKGCSHPPEVVAATGR